MTDVSSNIGTEYHAPASMQILTFCMQTSLYVTSAHETFDTSSALKTNSFVVNSLSDVVNSHDGLTSLQEAVIAANTQHWHGLDINSDRNFVTLKKVDFSGNGVGAAIEIEDGLKIDGSNNTITVSHFTSNNNPGDGIDFNGDNNKAVITGATIIVQIFQDDDLLAVVTHQKANTFSSNVREIFV